MLDSSLTVDIINQGLITLAMNDQPQVINNPNYVPTSGPTRLDLLQTGDPTRPIYVKYCHSETDAIILEASHAKDDWLDIKRVGNILYLTPPKSLDMKP